MAEADSVTHADDFYDEFLRQFIHHFDNKEKMDRRAFSEDLGKIGMEETENSILKNCDAIQNKYEIESYNNTKQIEVEIVENNQFVEKLIYFYMRRFENRLTRDILLQLLHFIGDRLYIYTFSNIDKFDYDFYYNLAHQAIEHFRTNKQSKKSILDKINYLNRKLYLTMHQLEFLTVPYRYTDTVRLVLDDVKYSRSLGLEQYIQALNNYIKINVDHLTGSLYKSEPYVDLQKLNGTLSQFRNYLKKYRTEETRNSYTFYDCLSSYFKFELYKLKTNRKKGVLSDEKETVKLFVQAAKLISVFYGRNEGYEIFFNIKDPVYQSDLATGRALFSEELKLLLNEEKLNVFEPLYLIFSFLSNYPEYTGLNQNVYKRLKFMSRNYNRRTYYLLSTTLYLKLLNDKQTFQTEIEKVKKNIEMNPTITLVTLYNNEIDTIHELDPHTKNSLKIDPFIMTIMDCVSQISKNINDVIINYKKKHEEDEDFFYRKQFLHSFENENLNVIALAKDPNLFRGLNQFYSTFLNSYLKTMKLDFREDYSKRLDQIKMDLMDLNPLDLHLSFVLSRLWKLLAIFKMVDPEMTGKTNSTSIEYFTNQKRNIDKVLNTFLKIKGHSINKESLKAILTDMTNPTRSGSSFLSPGSRMAKVMDALITKILKEEKADSEIFLSLYRESYLEIRKQWIYDPIMLYYINYYLSSRPKVCFYRIDSGKMIKTDLEWLKKGEIVQRINLFIENLFSKTTVENDIGLELEKLSQMNCELLIDDQGQRKNVTEHNINDYLKENKTVIYEKTIIDNKDDMVYLFRILEYYLKNAGKNSLLTNFKYILGELVKNANRGTLKRAHFKYRGLDMDRNYKIGIKDFQEKLDKNRSAYIRIAEESGFLVTVQFQILNNELIISVINRYKLHPEESEEINKRYMISRKCESLQSLQKMNTETEEGKGQGLVILNLMLRNLGLDENFLKVRSDEDQTLFRVRFPLQQLQESDASSLAEEITQKMDNIPPLPDHIVKLTHAIQDPDSSIDEIELIVGKDPSLAARIIQMANSPLYLRMEKVRNLKEAIQLIGLKGLGDIVLTYSSYKQLEGMVDEKRIEQIILHSEQTAFFAKELIRVRKMKISVANVYLPALIHDIGKIVIECVNADLYNSINKLHSAKNIPIPLLEDLMGGLYHNIVGYELAKKWGFPEVVGNIIKYHHDPRRTDEFFDEIFLIYLANELTRYNEGSVIYENLDRNVLEFFGINSQDALNRQVEELVQAYKMKV